MFKVGDKVKIPYISDCNPHNNKVGIITWLHDYSYYPNGDYSVIEKRTQGTITYDDGDEVLVVVKGDNRECKQFLSKG